MTQKYVGVFVTVFILWVRRGKCSDYKYQFAGIAEFALIFAWLWMEIYSRYFRQISKIQRSFVFEQMKMISVSMALTTIIINSKWTLCDTISFENMNLIWPTRLFDRL